MKTKDPKQPAAQVQEADAWKQELQPELRAIADAVPREDYARASARELIRINQRQRPRYAKT